jgi:hypothetical protein
MNEAQTIELVTPAFPTASGATSAFSSQIAAQTAAADAFVNAEMTTATAATNTSVNSQSNETGAATDGSTNREISTATVTADALVGAELSSASDTTKAMGQETTGANKGADFTLPSAPPGLPSQIVLPAASYEPGSLTSSLSFSSMQNQAQPAASNDVQCPKCHEMTPKAFSFCLKCGANVA